MPEEEERGNGEEKYIWSTNDSELSKINHTKQRTPNRANTKTKTNQQINQSTKQTN